MQRVIFRSHNDGDSIKIAIPLENVLDIEESPVVEFADTFKLKAVDNDETFAIDEVSQPYVIPGACPPPYYLNSDNFHGLLFSSNYFNLLTVC